MKIPCGHIQCYCRSKLELTIVEMEKMMQTFIDPRWIRREELRFASKFPGNLELENFLGEPTNTDGSPQEHDLGDCNMDIDNGVISDGAPEIMLRATGTDAGRPEVGEQPELGAHAPGRSDLLGANAPGASRGVKGKTPTYNEVLTEMKGILNAYQPTWQQHALELIGFMKKLSDHAETQQSPSMFFTATSMAQQPPAMFFTGMDKSLNNITVGGINMGSSSLSDFVPDNSPRPYHNSGNPRVLRIESARIFSREAVISSKLLCRCLSTVFPLKKSNIC